MMKLFWQERLQCVIAMFSLCSGSETFIRVFLEVDYHHIWWRRTIMWLISRDNVVTALILPKCTVWQLLTGCQWKSDACFCIFCSIIRTRSLRHRHGNTLFLSFWVLGRELSSSEQDLPSCDYSNRCGVNVVSSLNQKTKQEIKISKWSFSLGPLRVLFSRDIFMTIKHISTI